MERCQGGSIGVECSNSRHWLGSLLLERDFGRVVPVGERHSPSSRIEVQGLGCRSSESRKPRNNGRSVQGVERLYVHFNNTPREGWKPCIH